jgi:hypothetical protein
MLRNELKARLDCARLSYAQLACSTAHREILDAAFSAAKSVELTTQRVMNPQTAEQKRRPSDYVSKRLTDIAIRFNAKIATLPDNHGQRIDELRRAASELRSVLDQSA